MAKKSKKKAKEVVGALPANFSYGPEKFENESSAEDVERSEALSEKEIDKEETAIDKLLDGDDRALDGLEY